MKLYRLPVGLDECLDPGEVVKEVDVIEVEDAEGATLILVLRTQCHDRILQLGHCHFSLAEQSLLVTLYALY